MWNLALANHLRKERERLWWKTGYLIIKKFRLAVRWLLGTSGLSIAIAASTKSFEKFATARGGIYYLLFFCSIVSYPLKAIQGVLPQPLILLAQLNALSCGAYLIRAHLIGSPPFTIDLLQNLLIFPPYSR